MKTINEITQEKQNIQNEINSLKELISLKENMINLLDKELSILSNKETELINCSYLSYVDNNENINMEQIDKETFIDILKNNVVEIQYIKKNGDVVFRSITLENDRLPISLSETKTNKNISQNNNKYIFVFDIEELKWKKFLFSKIIEASIVLPPC